MLLFSCLFFSCTSTTTSSRGIQANSTLSLKAISSQALDRLNEMHSSHVRRRNSQSEVRRSVYPRREMVPRNAKSMERAPESYPSAAHWDSNYITNIDVMPNGGPALSENDECYMEYDVYSARPAIVQEEEEPKQQHEMEDDNEVVYGVVPLPNNNVKIVLRKPQRSESVVTAAPKQKSAGGRQGSIVHINSQKHSVPYCCTGKDMRSNEIRIVVNHR